MKNKISKSILIAFIVGCFFSLALIGLAMLTIKDSVWGRNSVINPLPENTVTIPNNIEGAEEELHLSTSSIALLAAPILSAIKEKENTFIQKSSDEDLEKKVAISVEKYLIENPEIILKAQQKLKERESLAGVYAIVKNKHLLIDDQVTPFIGPKDSNVAVIEFFDYQCVWCMKTAPVVDQAIKSFPDVRFVFKEYPIFSSRFPASGTGATLGLHIFNKRGGDAYLSYHNSIFSSGKTSGKLPVEEVVKYASSFIGGIPMSEEEQQQYKLVIEGNLSLGEKLGIGGTPSFIIMNANDPNVSTTTIIPGATDFTRLKAAIEKAKG